MKTSLLIGLAFLVSASWAGQQASKPAPAAPTVTLTKTAPAKQNIVVDDVTYSVYDRNESPLPSNVAANSKVAQISTVNRNSKIQVTFNVKKQGTATPIPVEQAFVAFVHEATGQEAIFVAEQEGGSYVADLDIKTQEKNFNGLSGRYTIRLIVGDSSAVNAIDWTIAQANIEVNPPPVKPVRKSQIINYDSLPAINHVFRQPEKRPPQIISDTFTIVCLTPLVLLLLLWLKIGINFGNVQFSLWALGFHAGLIGIFGLYVTFWLRLNMFETLYYLAIIGVPTFVSGHRLLRSLNEGRQAHAKTE